MIAAAHAAGIEICRVYRSGLAVQMKEDRSPVTAADHAAERIILAHLARLAPATPVIAEERVAAGEVPDIAARFFLVDPLDGTREFVSGNGEFTVNIALVEDGMPTLGVVYAPASAVLYAGDTHDRAAFRMRLHAKATPSLPARTVIRRPTRISRAATSPARSRSARR
jgi:3'(2'), 5'-bisphosphate nucleotidase